MSGVVGAGFRGIGVEVVGPCRALSRLWILFWVKGRSWEDSKQRIQAEEVMGGLQAEDHKPWLMF